MARTSSSGTARTSVFGPSAGSAGTSGVRRRARIERDARPRSASRSAGGRAKETSDEPGSYVSYIGNKRRALYNALLGVVGYPRLLPGLIVALDQYVLALVDRGPHDRPDCPCGHPTGTTGSCMACNCDDDDGVLRSGQDDDDVLRSGQDEEREREWRRLGRRLAHLRAEGWRVAVHNDYMLSGVLHTFWGLTRGTSFVKGEGRTDEEALVDAQRAIERLGQREDKGPGGGPAR
jgi:hypothetical protein